MNTFFIADPHFGHSNIISFESRPFTSAEEMDETLIRNWNNTVGKHDHIYVLGDLSFYNNTKTAEIVSRLHGLKFLVCGNHDRKDVGVYYAMGFHRVYDKPVIYDDFWMLSHEPLYINENMPYVNIFGHVHSNSQYTDFSNRSFCACVERINYTPISFTKIYERVTNL